MDIINENKEVILSDLFKKKRAKRIVTEKVTQRKDNIALNSIIKYIKANNDWIAITTQEIHKRFKRKGVENVLYALRSDPNIITRQGVINRNLKTREYKWVPTQEKISLKFRATEYSKIDENELIHLEEIYGSDIDANAVDILCVYDYLITVGCKYNWIHFDISSFFRQKQAAFDAVEQAFNSLYEHKLFNYCIINEPQFRKPIIVIKLTDKENSFEKLNEDILNSNIEYLEPIKIPRPSRKSNDIEQIDESSDIDDVGERQEIDSQEQGFENATTKIDDTIFVENDASVSATKEANKDNVPVKNNSTTVSDFQEEVNTLMSNSYNFEDKIRILISKFQEATEQSIKEHQENLDISLNVFNKMQEENNALKEENKVLKEINFKQEHKIQMFDQYSKKISENTVEEMNKLLGVMINLIVEFTTQPKYMLTDQKVINAFRAKVVQLVTEISNSVMNYKPESSFPPNEI